ncbi:MAG: mannitol dehydrogenase family protein [Acidimicrobiales bacterium]
MTSAPGALSLSGLAKMAMDQRPLVDPAALSIGIVHLGVGAFHRAHQAVYTERACYLTGEDQWGICGVSERSPAAADALRRQDCLYSLRVAGVRDSAIRVVGSIREALFAQHEPEALIARLADPQVKIVTLTVTEKGYRHNLVTRRLSLDDEELAADASGRAPSTVLGQLVRGLEARERADAGPLSVLSCDNLPENGGVLQSLVSQLIEHPRGRWHATLGQWVSAQVRFPCSMVDRIVPQPTPEDRLYASKHLGLVDHAAIRAEPFSQWVIEDSFAAARPDWPRAGAQLVTDVAPYVTLKLRVLNGAHSALSYLGVLAGYETVAEALARPAFEGFVRELIDDEVTPTLTCPPGSSIGPYRDQVLERFENAALAYRCSQVAADGSQKLPQRLFGVVRECLDGGKTLPRLTTTVIAAWIWALLRTKDDRGLPLQISDPFAGRLRALVAEAVTPSTVARRALQLGEVFGDSLAEDDRFRRLLTDALGALTVGGTEEAVQTLVSCTSG